MENLKSITDIAKEPPIVESFSITGLFGNRSVSFNSTCAATVLIAKNGSGKTTLLATLDAFLRGQFTRLATLDFQKITCKIRGHDNNLQITKKEVDQLIDLSSNSEIYSFAKAWEVEPLALLGLIENGVHQKQIVELRDNPTFYAICSKLSYDSQLAINQCNRLANTLKNKNNNLDQIRGTLKDVLKNVEIVYLPTYRRIELSLPDTDYRRGERRKSILSKLGIARSGLHSADIQFGLGDISERLSALYSEMRYRSNQGYGKVSANIINALITNEYKNKELSQKNLPSKESLEIFFERIKDTEKDFRRSSMFESYFAPPDINPIYSDKISEEAKPFLHYFLDQLNSVISESRKTEELVEAFKESCNRYLSGNDNSTDNYSSNLNNNFDKKKISINKKNLRVKVTSTPSDDEVPLEALSSGEKQMISLFARLYLYQNKKIILIDEPELSLSINWQRQILPDILQSPTCEQLIGITHSPFIFDNELEPYAGSLNLEAFKKPSDKEMPAKNSKDTEQEEENDE